MKIRIFSKIIDSLFFFISIFCVSFLWTRYYQHNSALVITYSLVISLSIFLLVAVIASKKEKTKNIAKNNEKLAKNMGYTLFFSSKTQVLSIFGEALKRRNLEYKICKNYIIFNDVALFPIYDKTTADESDILMAIKKSLNLKNKVIVLCAKNFTPQSLNFSKNYGQKKVIILGEAQTFNTFFKPIDYFF